jgi:hypothetical protein
MGPNCEGTNQMNIYPSKEAVRHMAVLRKLVSRRDSFRELKILIVYLLYIQETISCAKENCNCAVNKQVHTYNITIIIMIIIGMYIM